MKRESGRFEVKSAGFLYAKNYKEIWDINERTIEDDSKYRSEL